MAKLRLLKIYPAKFIAIIFFILLFGAYAKIFAIFSPGQTIDPNCAPLDSGCTVAFNFLTPTGSASQLTNFPTFNQNTTGTSANILGGNGGQILYQSGANITSKLSNGTAGQVLTSNGTTLAPSWTTVSASPISIVNSSNLFSTGLIGTGSGVTTISDSIFLGSSAGSSSLYASNSNFLGKTAGFSATNASDSNFLGNSAGSSAVNAYSSNFFGNSAGYAATYASDSNFLGNFAGLSATSASNSNFFGNGAGYSAVNASNSNFFGSSAGYGANASYSNFIGSSAGNGATDSSYSNFIGSSAGSGAVSASWSNFFGFSAGSAATNATQSNFFGNGAGYRATNASNSIFIGQSTGYQDTVDNTKNIADWSILIGSGIKTGGFKNSILLGGTTNFFSPVTNTKTNQFMLVPSITEMRLRGIDYSLPSSQGGANTILSNNGSGLLTWTSPSVSSQWTTTGSNINFNTGDVAIGNNATAGTLSLIDGTIYSPNFISSQTIGADADIKNVGTAGYLLLNGTTTANKYGNFGMVEIPSTNVNNITANIKGSQSMVSDYGTGILNQATGSQSTIDLFSNGTINQGLGSGSYVYNDADGTIGQARGADILVDNAAGGNINYAKGSGNYVDNEANGVIYDGRATQSFVENFGTGSMTLAYGSDASINNTYTGLISDAWGVSGNITNSGGGTITTARTYGSSVSNTVGSTIGTLYGLSIGGPSNVWSNAGTITTSYGIYLGSSIDVGATKYAIYSGSLSNSYYAGRVGIGAASPGYSLEVGNNTVSGVVARFRSSTGYCDINPITTSLSCSSDINLKKNIVNSNGVEFVLQTVPDLKNKTTLEKLSYLTPVNYNWKEELDTDPKHIGFIAQEMEQIFPDLVSTDSVTGLKSISYASITPYLVDSIKEMNLKISDLASLDTTKATSLGSLIKSFLADEYNRIDKIFVKTVVTDGIEMKDSITGDTYCVVITNGELNKVKGKCGEEITVNPIIEPEVKTDINPEIKTDLQPEVKKELPVETITELPSEAVTTPSVEINSEPENIKAPEKEVTNL
jgi:hypothetical protein